ncbi:radical SAM peptide maturase [Prevotella aurantiaca JCM 15754]|uniref:radical SAM peptide maturase n=1 Tax=Prevotella aurantiaca TaxID=596085 RepID=UPI00046B065F|nr:radical SAM peptide maturase [Prevotella aurantiaca]
MNHNFSKLEASFVERSFNNPSQIVFETTEKCNLACHYCTFRELYSHHDKRGLNGLKHMDLGFAKTFISYYIEQWKRKNYPYKDVYISFYGGEPLMNMRLVKCIVDIVNQHKHQIYVNPIYTMTTNGTLIHKYIDFLIENNFKVLISLDGDHKGNSLRVYGGSNQESFSIVYKNIKNIQQTYPIFYKNNISFNSVLHNKNGLSNILHFFEKHLDKKPMFSTVSPSSLNDSYRAIYDSIKIDFDNAIKELSDEESNKIWDDYMYNNPYVTELISYIFNKSGNVFKDLNMLLLGNSLKHGSYLSGTCLPFTKKVFLSARGLISPCERVSHNNSMGNILEGKVQVDYKEIADKYNEYYRKLSPQCLKCDNNKSCLNCVFQDDSFSSKGKCGSFSSNGNLNVLLKKILLSHPDIYRKIISETVFN